MHNESIIKRNAWHVIAMTVVLVVAFVILSPSAAASITVEGDDAFKDSVKECLDTYRDAPGIVGDVIKELEGSDFDHKITNSSEWDNTSDDLDGATGGDGSGTETRVDADALEEYKERSAALKDKDFCTALLHELWHAVDADRGTRTPHTDRIDGVKRNEIEATLFQNFIHAIRGVDPRTHYGGVDISEHVVISDDAVEETPPPTPAVTPPPPVVEEPKVATSAGTSFKHVVPGEYSEVYATVTTGPGASVKATLTGPGVDSAATQTITADSKGVAKFTWRIVLFGEYSVSGTAGADSFKSGVSVK